MAKTYDFRFIVRKAEKKTLGGGEYMTVMFGGTADVYHESCAEMTYAEAKHYLQNLSDGEPRTHRAILSMKYRDDRVPPGFNKNKNWIDGGN